MRAFDRPYEFVRSNVILVIQRSVSLACIQGFQNSSVYLFIKTTVGHVQDPIPSLKGQGHTGSLPSVIKPELFDKESSDYTL